MKECIVNWIVYASRHELKTEVIKNNTYKIQNFGPYTWL